MNQFYSTNNLDCFCSLKEAVFRGLAPDGGLLMPTHIPAVDASFLKQIHSLSLQAIAWEVAHTLLKDSLSKKELAGIIDEALSFDIPLIPLTESIHVLELFHGPTLSFKDVGARFMSRLMAHLNRHEEQELNILTATSGDTGSAVAEGFFNVPGIKVWILYPKDGVSEVQKKQMTTLGGNVAAIEIAGTFDDCQALVKTAFSDIEFCQRIRLTSANSINIARLIPQMFYYFYAYAQLKPPIHQVVISVPSGNFGNLTAGLIAKKMGLPIERFIAATNSNNIVPHYLNTGEFLPRPSTHTLSNAMDVGHPSNFARMQNLYKSNLEQMREAIFGVSFNDEETQLAIQELYNRYGYIADPHGAISYLGLRAFQAQFKDRTGIFFETAHPAKFLDVVEPLIKTEVHIPDRLKLVLAKEGESICLTNKYKDLKAVLSV